MSISRGGIVVDSKHDLQAFVGCINASRIAVVSFRGTVETSIKDWIENLDETKETPTTVLGDHVAECVGCKAHSGFYKSWLHLRPGVLSALAAIPGGVDRYVITGHSLGGALAQLCALDLVLHGVATHSSLDVWTFGEPRVANAALAKFAMGALGAYWRHVHWKDIVPHAPLEAMGFHHTRSEIFFNEASSVHTLCDGSGEDPACSDQFVVATSVSDHLRYLNRTMGSSSC